MKFRKKPLVIEAWQNIEDPEEVAPMPPWLNAALAHGSVWTSGAGFIRIKTLEGVMSAGPNDWIIQGVQGELYPCKNAIFRETYERAE